MDQQRAQFISCGANEVVPKPINKSMLHDVVTRYTRSGSFLSQDNRRSYTLKGLLFDDDTVAPSRTSSSNSPSQARRSAPSLHHVGGTPLATEIEVDEELAGSDVEREDRGRRQHEISLEIDAGLDLLAKGS